jgi:putative transposase
MARKQKFSNNWKKAKANVTKTHQKIANVRRDHLHKATTTLSKNHAVVVVEDLQVRSMSKSAAGTAGQPGRNVKAKSGLNRSILSGSRSLGAVGIPVLGRGGCQREQPA